MATHKLEQGLKEHLLQGISRDKWARIGIKRRAGLLVPMFCVYSRRSLGIGDLEDLKLLIDFCKESGNSILQLLPMNEMGGLFCPYDALSSFALEPVYLSLDNISGAKKDVVKKRIDKIRKDFPCGRAHVDYRIKEEKARLLHDVFAAEFKGVSAEFGRFIEENSYWLADFALFKVLKDYYGGRAWYEWDDSHRNRDTSALKDFRKKHEKEIIFQLWLQWQLYRQFREAKEYARDKKVLLKGDMPVLVSRDSADVWVRPEFFKQEFAAGAPPDMYCAKGQRWGMPTYNWETIANDGYRYLKEKFRYAQNFYDIVRIDHAVGLFRIWSIPYNESLENQGLNGFFDPRDESKWEAHGKGVLTVMLNDTDMLLCAEDLGIIPLVCPKTLKEFGIPGNDVQRWVKDWDTRHDFLDSGEYRELSVAVLSTHDTTNWAAWWENEAGTVDEGMFMRKCGERGIDYSRVKNQLFDAHLSRHKRLCWLESIDSAEKLAVILGKRKEELADFIDIYENTYREKEKLWQQLKMKGPMEEKADKGIISAVLRLTLESRSIFCIQLITDYLSLADILKGDPYKYRINTPGTISPDNWSLVIPLALEDLAKHKICSSIKSMVVSSGRDNRISASKH